jgi:hypothetical protein
VRKSGWIVIGVIVVVLALCAAGLTRLVEWVPVEQRTGFSSEARQNRFLAGELLLRRLGYAARTLEDRQVFDRQAEHSTLLLESDEAFADPKLRRQLLDWVHRGGHLILPLESSNDTQLLDELGISITGRLDDSAERYSLPLEGQRITASLQHAPVFALDAEPQWSIDLLGHFDDSDTDKPKKKGKHTALPEFTPQATNDPSYGTPLATGNIPKANDLLPKRQHIPAATADDADAETSADSATPANEDKDANPQSAPDSDADAETETGEEPDTVSVYARYAYGKGLVTVGDFSLFSNRSIDKQDHAALFVRLLTLPERKQPVVILSAPKYPGLLEWLVEHASEAWFAAAVLLLAGLWRVIPRFGPLLPEPPPVRPGLGEHLTACGRFLLQRCAYEYLILPLREEVLRALEEQRHLHPEITNRTLLAAHLSGMRPADIDRALAADPDTHHEFLRRVQTLAALRTLCKRLRKPSSVSGALS